MKNSIDSKHKLTKKQGQILVKLARKTIMERLGQKMPREDVKSLEKSLKDKAFENKCGTFVTLNLKLNEELRGCIGSLEASEPILSGIRHNSINAAFNDYRFPALNGEELDQVKIEVSILTDPQKLEYTDSIDLLDKLRVDVDGLIIRHGSARATFLPQVWQALPEPEEFLSHLCKKAGLPANAWEETKLEVLTYQVQYFEEK
ncbi:MAG: AmmeMemoRadiSam system protein A [Desulfobacterales bacterium]|jgi:AmmeMemoRadiSam system protein A|nr:AmmeMemoRadiSam system protein A [Desulfobacteraceae bacterium]MBT7085859.1 AmmeMemoRadiSam system protein A [Desulfobacterales bacterium]MBT7697283.1 AmmeMemoRadiSam system protein A [Desulfobacterales bacterium]